MKQNRYRYTSLLHGRQMLLAPFLRLPISTYFNNFGLTFIILYNIWPTFGSEFELAAIFVPNIIFTEWMTSWSLGQPHQPSGVVRLFLLTLPLQALIWKVASQDWQISETSEAGRQRISVYWNTPELTHWLTHWPMTEETCEKEPEGCSL